MTAAILKKALFALLKNYCFQSWKLNLGHLIPTFLNLGINESTILDQEFYDKMLRYRLKKNDQTFDIENFLPHFFKQRFHDSQKIVNDCENESEVDEVELKEIKSSYVDSEDEDIIREVGNEIPEDYHWEANKYAVLRRVIETISDLICTFPQLVTMLPDVKKNDWIESLVSFYIFGTVASDWHLIMDSQIYNSLKNAFWAMLDAYPR